MSEFGNETATAAMKAGEKSIEALMKLLKFIMERNDRKLNREMKKEQVRQIKATKNKEKIAEYLNERRGYVRAQKLFKTGERLIPLASKMSPNELSRFNKLAKIEGVAFTAISNQQAIERLKEVKKELKELGKIAETEGLTEEQILKQNDLQNEKDNLEKNRQDRIVIIRAKDLELVKDITDRMNMEIRMNDINNELGDLLNKGEENLSEEEKNRVEELLKEKDGLLKNEFTGFNDKNNDIIYQGTTENPVWEEMSFERAINKVTEREYSQEPCYICERTNPNNYMEVTSHPQEHNGRTFTNTEYKVYNNGVEQKCNEFSHGKFTHYSRKDGENSSAYGDEHWQNMRKEMKEKGGFSDDALVFSSKENYEKYKSEFIKTQEKITPKEDTVAYEADKNSYKDYMGIVNNLNSQLAEHNFVLNEQKEIYRTDNREVVHLDENMADDEKIACAEAINIAKQINVYQELNKSQTELAFVRQQQNINEDNYENQGKPEILKNMYEKIREELYKKAYDLGGTIASLEGKASKLQIEREQLSSIPIIDKIQKKEDKKDRNDENLENETKKDNGSHREEGHTQSKQQWNKEVHKQNTATINSAENVNVVTAERDM